MTRTPELTRVHRILIGTVAGGSTLIALIGFAGSYAAVRDLAGSKGFGTFALVLPIGIDAGIVVLLALDLLLTWLRIPFPLLRHTAWLLTAATIAFNGAAAWPDPLAVAMHAVIPVLFVAITEAARHAVGRIADITADKHMDGVRLTRWLLAPGPTFRLWRRMKLWELRSYEQVIQLEQERLIYRARLRAAYGRAWRWKAPVEALLPLRLTRYGVALPGPADEPADLIADEAPDLIARHALPADEPRVRITARLPIAPDEVHEEVHETCVDEEPETSSALFPPGSMSDEAPADEVADEPPASSPDEPEGDETGDEAAADEAWASLPDEHRARLDEALAYLTDCDENDRRPSANGMRQALRIGSQHGRPMLAFALAHQPATIAGETR